MKKPQLQQEFIGWFDKFRSSVDVWMSERLRYLFIYLFITFVLVSNLMAWS